MRADVNGLTNRVSACSPDMRLPFFLGHPRRGARRHRANPAAGQPKTCVGKSLEVRLALRLEVDIGTDTDTDADADADAEAGGRNEQQHPIHTYPFHRDLGKGTPPASNRGFPTHHQPFS